MSNGGAASGRRLLCDLTSSYVEGRCCPLAKRGYSRDGVAQHAPDPFGLLCNRDGCPVAVEVFEGNTADPSTVSVQVEKLQRRFGLQRVVLVGDRGMLTEARIREDLKPAGLDWISACARPAIRELVDPGPCRPRCSTRRLIEIGRCLSGRTAWCAASALAFPLWRPPNGCWPDREAPPPAPRAA